MVIHVREVLLCFLAGTGSKTLIVFHLPSVCILCLCAPSFKLWEGCPVLPTDVQTVRRIPWTSWDPPLVSLQTQAPKLSGGSLGHPGILPWSPLRHRPPCCPEDPLDIPGSSLGVPSDTGPQAVRRIPWTSRDPPLVSPQTQAPKLSGGSLGHPGILPWCPLRHRPPCCPEDPLDIPGSSLGVPSDTGPQAVRRIPWTSWDPPLVSPQTQAPMLSGGSLGHPGILPWCPFRHRLSIGYSSIIS